MRADRLARDRRGRLPFRDDESAVSEAVGYIITFGVSTVILVTSLAAFQVIDDYTTDLATDRALDEVAGQVGYAMTQALRAGSEYPEGTFEFTVTLPRDINGVTYEIWIEDRFTLHAEATQIQTPDAKGALGTVVLDVLRKGETQTLCPTKETEVGDGRCWTFSTSGTVTVKYATTTEAGAPASGVYFEGPGT